MPIITVPNLTQFIVLLLKHDYWKSNTNSHLYSTKIPLYFKGINKRRV